MIIQTCSAADPSKPIPARWETRQSMKFSEAIETMKRRVCRSAVLLAVVIHAVCCCLPPAAYCASRSADINGNYLLALELWADGERSNDRGVEMRALELFSRVADTAGTAEDERELAAACLVHSAKISDHLGQPVSKTLEMLFRVIDDFGETSWVSMACQMIKSLKSGTPLPDTALLRSIINLETSARQAGRPSAGSEGLGEPPSVR